MFAVNLIAPAVPPNPVPLIMIGSATVTPPEILRVACGSVLVPLLIVVPVELLPRALAAVIANVPWLIVVSPV